MEMPEILGQVTGSLINISVITAAVVYFVRRTIDTAIDTKLQVYLEQQRAMIQEESRRRSALHEEQVERLKTVTGLIQEAVDLLHIFGGPDDDDDLNYADDRLRSVYNDIKAYLRDSRIYLPDDIFMDLDESAETIMRFWHRTEDYVSCAKQCEIELAARHENLVRLLQKQLGVRDKA